MDKLILDVTCGDRTIWFQKNEPHTIYCDIRREEWEGDFGKTLRKDGKQKHRHLVIDPDIQCSFTDLPFKDNTFKMVVFDPPHIKNLAETSWMRKSYGSLDGDWEPMIRQGFQECMRVLRVGGVMIFKWSDISVSTREIINVIGQEPLFGHRSGRNTVQGEVAMPRYTRCPFYIDESRHSISCEDVCRSYDSLNEKLSWMDIYCDSWDWQKCPYAVDISEAYRRYEEGDEMALIEQELKAQKKEIESLLRKLGRANKKLDKERAKNKDLESQKKIYFEKWRKADEQLREYEKKIADQLGAMAGIYEQRMAYLIDSYAADGRLYEQEVEAWAGDRAFAITHDEDGAGRFWKVVFQEEENDENTQKQE